MSADKQTLKATKLPQQPVLAPVQAHAIVQDWLNIQCGMINGVGRALVVLVGDDEQAQQSLACWPAELDATEDLFALAAHAMQEQQCKIEHVGGEQPRDRIVFPIAMPMEANLILTLEISGRSEIQ
ncbi:MAG: hypothetical protein ACR2P1_04445, partial [Pseudomonadales bacterium]